MKMPLLVLWSLVLTVEASAGCFERTFCSTGAATKYILCSRGHDCSKAKDKGMAFQKDCQVSRFLGDAMETRRYQIQDKSVQILPPAWTPEVKPEHYRLSASGNELISEENGKFVWSVQACK